MEGQAVSTISCDCHPPRQSWFTRYRDFLFSQETILVFLNALTLLVAFALSLLGKPHIARWVYLLSALIGGMPLFVFTARQIFIKHEFTSGVMASMAVIAALLVGEYSAAAIVVLMMSLGEWLENLTVARADRDRTGAKFLPQLLLHPMGQSDGRFDDGITTGGCSVLRCPTVLYRRHQLFRHQRVNGAYR